MVSFGGRSLTIAELLESGENERREVGLAAAWS
jgi:hypothetical protein